MTEATAGEHGPVGGRPFPSDLFQRIIRDSMTGGVASHRFVGRSAELGRLEAAFAQARSGAPVTVCVGGEAGVGKTRLVSEFAARVRHSGGRVLLGGCIELGEGALPFGPVAEALRGLGRELGPDGLDELVGPGQPMLARLLPELRLAHPGLPDAPSSDRYLPSRGRSGLPPAHGRRLGYSRPCWPCWSAWPAGGPRYWS